MLSPGVLSHIKDQNLKSRMYREENYEYHDKGAMVLVSGKSESKTKGDVNQ